MTSMIVHMGKLDNIILGMSMDFSRTKGKVQIIMYYWGTKKKTIDKWLVTEGMNGFKHTTSSKYLFWADN